MPGNAIVDTPAWNIETTMAGHWDDETTQHDSNVAFHSRYKERRCTRDEDRRFRQRTARSLVAFLFL